jgi:hypothetical protein
MRTSLVTLTALAEAVSAFSQAAPMPGADGRYTISAAGIKAQVGKSHRCLEGNFFSDGRLVHSLWCYPHEPHRQGQEWHGHRRCSGL